MKDDIAEVLTGNRRWAVVQSDVIEFLSSLPDGCVHTCVTSPPYFQLRDYGVAGQIGLEATPEAFIAALVKVFREVRRVLHPAGTFWLNIADSYNTSDKWGGGGGNTGKQTIAEGGVVPSWEVTRKRKPKIDGVKPKDLIGVPWMLAFALRADGWYLRQDVIWHKPSPMPSSVKDRCTTAHEYLFLLSKEPRYYFDSEAISEPAVSAGKPIPRTGGWADGPGSHSAIDHNQSGRQSGYRKTGELCGETRAKRSVWRVASKPFKGAHFATFPPDLVRPCIRAGSSERGCCPSCFAPWERITDRRRRATRPGTASKVTGDSLTDGNRDPQRHVTTTTTIGWRPTCCCEAGEPIPCLILDPFGGSGTTVAVANEEGRHGIACDLNPDYVALAHERMSGVVFGSGPPPKKIKRPRRPKEEPNLFTGVC